MVGTFQEFKFLCVDIKFECINYYEAELMVSNKKYFNHKLAKHYYYT